MIHETHLLVTAAKVPLVPHMPGEDIARGSSSARVLDPPQRKLPDFLFSRHLPDVLNRVLTEIAGAPFVLRANKRKSAPSTAEPGTDDVVDINDLLSAPKKKARRTGGAKSKAKAKPKASSEASAVDTTDVVMAGGDTSEATEGSSRARWWIDDVIACLAHAAGGV